MARVLLILPSSTYRAPDFMAAARSLGAEVVVASDRRQALSAQLGERALVLPLHRPEAAADRIVAHAAATPLDAVVAVDDPGVLVAALASERLGLRHAAPAAVRATRDKAGARDLLTGAGMPQPAFARLPPGADAGALAREVGLPCVVKPLSLGASRGVIRADSPEGADAAADRTRRILADAGRPADEALLIERYLPGTEVAVEGLLRGGRLEVLAVFDKPDPLEGPFFEETIYVTPSRLPERTLALVRRRTAEAAAALGLREGPVHAELRVDDDEAWVLELAARSIGGLCGRTLRFGLGVRLEELVLRHALDLPLDGLTRERTASGVMMLPIPSAGVLTGLRGRDAALAVPGVAGLEVSIPVGRPVRPLPEADRYLGFLFARAERPEQVESALREAHGRLEVVIERDAATAA